MIYFVSYRDDANQLHCLRFFTIELMFKWLQEWKNEKGSWPTSFSVYKADCVFDGS